MQGLSFEQAPPISVPFRFFLTAPLFGIAAGLLLLWQGPDVFVSRWGSPVLALTHLMAVGFMLHVMCGALLQIVPVAVGANIWRPSLVSGFTHAGLLAGTVVLVSAFLIQSPLLFKTAAILLGATLGAFAAVVLLALIRTPAKGPALFALRLALLALFATLILGTTLASSFGWQVVLPLIELTHLHAAWGLGGWSMLLVMGVAYFVVPMLQLTPPYPKSRAWVVPACVFAFLSVWSLLWLAGPPASIARTITAVAGVVAAAVFAGSTLQLQRKRRRKVVEATLLFWRAAMISLLAALALILAAQSIPAFDGMAVTPFLIGILLLFGVFMSVICGMLFKIVPFLNWLHLQNLGARGFAVPNMRQMIPEPRIRTQLKLHLAMLAVLLASLWVNVLVYPAALLLIADCAWLEWNLINASRLYARTRETAAAQPA